MNRNKKTFCTTLSLQHVNNFDDITSTTQTKHYPNWPYILDHLLRILIISGSGLGKTNALSNLICHQTNIDKIYLYAKDPYPSRY